MSTLKTNVFRSIPYFVSAGPTSEESGEHVCLTAEDCGSSHQVSWRGGSLQDSEEEEEKQLSGCKEEAGGH